MLKLSAVIAQPCALQTFHSFEKIVVVGTKTRTNLGSSELKVIRKSNFLLNYE